jgi:hypothetical protein
MDGTRENSLSNRIIHVFSRYWFRITFVATLFLQFARPQRRSGCGGEQKDHLQDWNELQQQPNSPKPGVSELSLLDEGFSLLLIVSSQVEEAPVMKRPSTVARQQQEYWNADYGYEIDGEQYHELGDLTQREWCIDSGSSGLPKRLDWVWLVRVDGS